MKIIVTKQTLSKIFLLIAILLLGAGLFWAKNSNLKTTAIFSGLASISSEKAVLAKEIYPLFLCPCCGQTIDAQCCDLAKERKAYVDSLVQTKDSEEEIILAYVQKYGLDSFKEENKKEEFREKLVLTAPDSRPIISISPSFSDLGEVSASRGVVTTLFELKNQGESDLLIERLETSCGCTSASIVFEGKEGPRFSMPGHGNNEKIEGWQVSIPPGQKAQLKVYYDPAVHQDFRGPAIREIYVFSNDPIDFEKKVRIELNQVD